MVTQQQNDEARKILASLTPDQIDEVGVMLGMENFGCQWSDRPEAMAESEAMYADFMTEIRVWQKRLKSKRGEWSKWGWCDDLAEMAKEAILRKPTPEQREAKLREREIARGCNCTPFIGQFNCRTHAPACPLG